MSEKEDKIVKNIILSKALHEYKMKVERSVKNDANNDTLNKILEHINELEDME